MKTKHQAISILAGSAFSSLGLGYASHYKALLENRSGVQKNDYPALGIDNLPVGMISESLFREQAALVKKGQACTRFETLLIRSIEEATCKLPLKLSGADTALIISTTKGNIDCIGDAEQQHKLSLNYSAAVLKNYFSLAATPMVISNACISGVLSIIHAQRLLQQRQYKHVVVVGGDVLSDFVISGFDSFKSLSRSVCKPFDKDRDGLTIGEAAACLVLSSTLEGEFIVSGGATANDANHISGPSRTGEGLFQAITHAATKEQLAQLDYVSAHGTATLYNDDMESVAMSRAGIAALPVNSYKGYVGHTLGAAGIVETLFSLWSMQHNTLFKTYGYKNPGTAEPINVIDENKQATINKTLKLASGFGGCNAAMIIERNA